MTCPLCGGVEGEQRCNWPMAKSPRAFRRVGTDELEFFEPDRFVEESLRMSVMAGVE